MCQTGFLIKCIGIPKTDLTKLRLIWFCLFTKWLGGKLHFSKTFFWMISKYFCKDFFWLNTITYTRTLPFCRSITTALAFVSRHRIPGHSTETFPAQLNFLRCPALHSCVSSGRRGNVYTLNSTLHNLHFTLHTTHYTPHFTPYTPHPTPHFL